jgi:dolichyl-phosphate-mannose--protein O-mannosyl transferase
MRLVQWFRIVGDRFGVLPIIALAAITRLWNLGFPNKLVFDETYYVKDAYSLWQVGHELSWPKAPVESFNIETLDVGTAYPEFVVHAPLGKWIIGLGMRVLGPDNPWGWRIMPAIFGILAVWLVYLIAKRLIGSARWALLPAFLLAIDGQAIVISRTAILDGIVTTFLLLGFYLLLRATSAFKPLPWLLLMGLALGAGSAVKWTGFIFLGVFLAYYLVASKWQWKALLAAPVALVAYLLSWIGWFATQGWGYRANNVVGSFIDYHQQMFHFHSTLSMFHPYQSNPLTWLAMVRPTSFFYEPQGPLVSAINPIGNPIIWLAGIISLGFLFGWFAQYRDKLSLLVFTGIIAGYLPWVLYLNRTTFQFYSVTFEPWIFLAIAVIAYRYRTIRTVVIGSIAATAVFIFFLPVYIGTQIPFWFWQWHMWLPTWV